MKITTLIDKPDGTYEFSAVLTPAQHQFLIEYAVRDLMTKGLLPFTSTHTANTDLLVGHDEMLDTEKVQ